MLPNKKFQLLLCMFFTVAIPAAGLAKPVHVGDSGLKNAVILIIRHAEDPDSGSGLSPIGSAHARAYVNYLKTLTVNGRPFKLDYLFATKDSTNSQRPRLTVEPIGRALGLPVDDRFKNKRFLDLVQEIQSLPEGQNILICWHHGTIPNLLRALGADPMTVLPNGKWPNDVYDWLIELSYDENGRLVQSRRISENLSFDEWRRPNLASAW